MRAILRQTRLPLRSSLFLATVAVFTAAHGPSVLTQHNNNARTGAVLQETHLDVSNVNSKTFGKLAALKVDDQIYTQPLIVPDRMINGREGVNVVFVATVNNSVYAFDADNFVPDQKPLWSQNYNDPSQGIGPVKNTDVGQNCGEYHDFSGNIGIVGTPVINDVTDTMYFVVRTKQNGKYFQWLHAIDIKNGNERPSSPTEIKFSVPGSGEGSVNGMIAFDPRKQNQRTALLLSGNTVYMGWASHCDTGPYHGYLAGFDADTLALKRVFNTTPGGGEGGIWQAGQGASADADGNIYIVTGNGTFDAHTGGNNYGQAFLKLAPTESGFKVASWFTPFNYDQLNRDDNDLGGSGALLIPDTHLVLSGGKGGVWYLVDRDNMGGWQADSDSQIVQSINVADNRHLHGSPTWWEGPNGKFAYVWAEYKHLRAYRFNGTQFELPAFGESTMAAPDGMPGGFLSISAYGSKAGTGILWASHPFLGDANQAARAGILRAFDASDITKEIWNSRQNLSDDLGLFAKFTSPTIANGKVYASTFSGQLVVYGLLPSGSGGTVPVPQTGSLTHGLLYSITSAQSGKCIDISNASHNNGVRVQQWDCNKSDAQAFRPQDNGDGSYSLINLVIYRSNLGT
ncbi:MAG: RICIN domain-containing protein [Chitinophagaceae bacterium]|nr:RICIN domain-containing protein [Oligoflexus sp.]